MHFKGIAPTAHKLVASGGELLVPPRSSARMRLKEALSAKPPSLRILPASEESGLLRRLTARTQCHRESFSRYVLEVENQRFGDFLSQYSIVREFHASVRTGAEQRNSLAF